MVRSFDVLKAFDMLGIMIMASPGYVHQYFIKYIYSLHAG